MLETRARPTNDYSALLLDEGPAIMCMLVHCHCYRDSLEKGCSLEVILIFFFFSRCAASLHESRKKWVSNMDRSCFKLAAHETIINSRPILKKCQHEDKFFCFVFLQYNPLDAYATKTTRPYSCCLL